MCFNFRDWILGILGFFVEVFFVKLLNICIKNLYEIWSNVYVNFYVSVLKVENVNWIKWNVIDLFYGWKLVIEIFL